MSDYLKIEYSEEKRPTTDYPSKLANYLFETLNLKVGQSLLDFGSGRAEILSSFSKLGLETFAVDSAESSSQCNLEVIEVKTFRKLPNTWHSSFFNFLAYLTSFFAPLKQKTNGFDGAGNS